MRLTNDQVRIIKEQTGKIFGPGAQVWVFGSRVNDAARGGDIDLFIEADATPEEALDRELQLFARLQRHLGEQRIDIVVHQSGKPFLPIHEAARQTGVRL